MVTKEANLNKTQDSEGIDSIKEAFMKLSLNELVLLAAEIKNTFEEKGLGFMLAASSADSVNNASAKEEKEEKAMVRLTKVPFVIKDKIVFIKLLAEKMSWPLTQAKGAIEVLPLILKESTSLEEANALKAELSAIPEVEITVEVL